MKPETRAIGRRDLLVGGAVVMAAVTVGASCASSPSRATTTSGNDKALGPKRMGTRRLGKLEVSELGAGCMSISANYGPPADRKRGIAVIRAAHEQGVTLFDTAEVYGPHSSEDLVGEALAPIRNQVSIATKFGYDIEAGGHNSRPDHIKKVIEGSLKRLLTEDYIIEHGIQLVGINVKVP